MLIKIFAMPIHDTLSLYHYQPKQASMKDLNLKTIAETMGVSVRDLRHIVIKELIEDENVSKRILEAKQTAVNDMQLNLMKIQLHNEAMRESMLTAKLQRHIWWQVKKEKFTKLFKRNEPKNRISKDQTNSQ